MSELPSMWEWGHSCMTRNAAHHSSLPPWESRGAQQQRHSTNCNTLNIYNGAVIKWTWEEERGGSYMTPTGVILTVPDFPLDMFLEKTVRLRWDGWPQVPLWCCVFKNYPVFGVTSKMCDWMRRSMATTGYNSANWRKVANLARDWTINYCAECDTPLAGGFLFCQVCKPIATVILVCPETGVTF